MLKWRNFAKSGHTAWRLSDHPTAQLDSTGWITYSKALAMECDQIGQFIALWATIQSLCATSNLPKYSTILGNFCKDITIIHFSSEIILGHFYWHLAIFIWYLVTLIEYYKITLADERNLSRTNFTNCRKRLTHEQVFVRLENQKLSFVIKGSLP